MLLNYTAIRNIATGAGHASDEDYTIAIGARQLVPGHEFKGTSTEALDGTIETDLQRIEESWSLTTDLIEVGDGWDIFLEFLHSTMGGERFIFDPDSSNPAAEVSPTLVVREPKARIRRPQNQPRHFTVSFTVRKVPA